MSLQELLFWCNLSGPCMPSVQFTLKGAQRGLGFRDLGLKRPLKGTLPPLDSGLGDLGLGLKSRV